MVEQLLKSLLFYFFSAEFRCREKVRDPPNYPRSVICWDLFLYFLGHFGVTNGRHSRSALYRAENIRDQLFVWNFFFINNGRHGTTALYWFPLSIGPRCNGAAVYMYFQFWFFKCYRIYPKYSDTINVRTPFFFTEKTSILCTLYFRTHS